MLRIVTWTQVLFSVICQIKGITGKMSTKTSADEDILGLRLFGSTHCSDLGKLRAVERKKKVSLYLDGLEVTSHLTDFLLGLL